MRELDLVTVTPSQWVETARAHKNDGFDYFDFLSVRELDSGEFVLNVHLLDLVDSHRILLEGTWTAEAATMIPSLSEVFAGARWHELEASELFRLEFIVADGDKLTQASSEPFIADKPALRRDFALAPRLDREWPGTNEPGLAPDHPRRKRKRAVPGNPASWESANG